LEQAKTWIEAKNQELARAKKSRQIDVLDRAVKQMLTRKRVKKLFKIEIEPYTVTVKTQKGHERTVNTFRIKFALKDDALREEQRLDGITCFITNLPQERCSAKEAIDYYRRKNKVEEAFHEIKSQIRLRPIHLTRSQRVKAHVTVCILAYFLINDMEVRLKARNVGVSPQSAFKEFKKCQVSRIEIKGSNKSKLQITKSNCFRRWIVRP